MTRRNVISTPPVTLLFMMILRLVLMSTVSTKATKTGLIVTRCLQRPLTWSVNVTRRLWHPMTHNMLTTSSLERPIQRILMNSLCLRLPTLCCVHAIESLLHQMICSALVTRRRRFSAQRAMSPAFSREGVLIYMLLTLAVESTSSTPKAPRRPT